MCLKCDDLDKRIAQYRRLAERLLDELVLKGLQKLVADLEREKTALHPASEPESELCIIKYRLQKPPQFSSG
jgi:hypothetical protein